VVIEQPTVNIAKCWGYSGGLSKGAANTRIRKNFQALAYYNASVITDTKGQASVTFKLPDDLTKWRVMVVATNGNLRFGNGEGTFMTTKLITNAILPQFAQPGDRLIGVLSITNNTGSTGELMIKGELKGNLQFSQNNPTTTLQSKAQSATHAFEIPLEIRPLELTEQVVEAGVTEGQVKIPLNLTNGRDLDLQLASTLIPEIKAPSQQMLTTDDLPFAEPAASQLLIAANLQTITCDFIVVCGHSWHTDNFSMSVLIFRFHLVF